MGAVSLEEVAENIDDFVEAVPLKTIERQRVRKWSAQLLQDQGHYNQVVQPTMSPPAASRPILSLTCGGNVQPIQAAATTMPYMVPISPLAARFPAAASPTGAIQGTSGAPAAGPHGEEVVVMGAPRNVRLAVDRHGGTGLELCWDSAWGIQVQRVDPLPGQIGITSGDRIVAVDGVSLQQCGPQECNQLFSDHIRNGATLSVVSPLSRHEESPTLHLLRNSGKGSSKGAGYGHRSDRGLFGLAAQQRRNGGDGQKTFRHVW